MTIASMNVFKTFDTMNVVISVIYNSHWQKIRNKEYVKQKEKRDI